MDRRRFLLTSLAGVLAAPLGAGAQQTGKVHTIGLVGIVPASEIFGPHARWPHFRVFIEELRALGWVEGRNVRFVRRSDEGQPERRRAVFEELVRLPVDVLVTVTNAMARVALDATRSIPIVMAAWVYPVERGLVASLSRPGGNITGITLDAGPGIDGKRLQLLKEALPRASRIAVLRPPPSPDAPLFQSEFAQAARMLGVTLVAALAQDPDQFERAFAAATGDRADAVFVTDWPPNSINDRLIVAQAAKHRLPATYSERHFVELGGLMAYGAASVANFGRAATYVDKILRGANPGNLAIEQPTKFKLVINLKTAKAPWPHDPAIAVGAG
jgi:putative ABC transport system substrate-binding protein